MRPGAKRAAVAIAATLLAAGALLLALRLAVRSLESGALRERARLAAEVGLTRVLAELGLDARVRVGALEGPLLPRAVLRDVRVEAGGSIPLRIDRLAGRVDLGALLARRAVLDALRVEGVELALTREAGPGAAGPEDAAAEPPDAAPAEAPDAALGWTWQRIRRPPPAPGAPAWWDAFLPTRLELRGLAIPQAKVALRWAQDGTPSVLELEADAALEDLVVALGPAVEAGAGGPWPARARLTLRASPGSVAGRRLDAATASLRLEGSVLHVDEARLESAFGRAQLSAATDLAGWLADDGSGALALEGAVSALDLGVLLDRPALAGSIDLRGRLRFEGPAGAAFAAARASADLTLGPSRLGTLHVQAGRLAGWSAAGRFSLEEARFEGPFGRVDARGEGDRERLGALALEASVRDLAALDALAALLGREPVGLAGRATLRAALRGAWAQPAGTLALETQALRAAGLDIGQLRLHAESPDGVRVVVAPLVAEGGALDLEALEPVRLRREGAGLWIDAPRLRGSKRAVASLTGWISPSAVRDLRIELPDLALAPFAPFVLPNHRLGGSASLRLVANGALLRPTLSGDLVWTRPRIDGFEAERLEVSVAAGAGSARAEAVLRGAGRALLTATASLPWQPDVDPAAALAHGDAHLHVAGEAVDLGLLGPFVEPALARPEGRADLVLDVRAGAGGPALDGSLRVLGARFDVTALGQRMGPLDARLGLAEGSLRIEDATLLGPDGGNARLTGRLDLEGLRPDRAELRVVANDFLVRVGTGLRFGLSGQLEAGGPLDALYTRGDVRLDDFRFYLRPGNDPLLREITVVEPGATPQLALGEIAAPEPSGGGPWAGASVDVTIAVPKGSRAVGQGANVELAGELRAAKAPQRPLGLYGEIRTLAGGSYRAQGRMFTVAPSKIVFDGRADAVPILDVGAEGSAGGVKILVRVGGRATDPTIRLESEPPYPERDILALLLFGRTREQLGRNEAGTLQSFLTQTTGGAAMETLNALLGPTFHIDTIEATPSERGEGGTIGVGRWVTNDLFVQYGHGYGDSLGSEVRLDWKLFPGWSLESRYSSAFGSSADMIWSYDY